MDFDWSYATLLAFFFGIVVGGLCQYCWPLGRKRGKPTTVCPHCGKALAD